MAFTEAINEIFKNLIQKGSESREFNISNIEITVRFINGIISESMKPVTFNPELKVEG
ncbi:MAG: hypothetical protein JXJ22_16730 [Bacteroidales bacterium]|nr:hypothetical protein [Bacteroidales bacterium]